MSGFIADSAEIINSTHGENLKMYRNARLIDSACGKNVSVGEEATVLKSRLGDYVSVNRRNYIRESSIGVFTDIELNANVLFAEIGNFSTISRSVDIGGNDHDYKKISTASIRRLVSQVSGGGRIRTFKNAKSEMMFGLEPVRKFC